MTWSASLGSPSLILTRVDRGGEPRRRRPLGRNRERTRGGGSFRDRRDTTHVRGTTVNSLGCTTRLEVLSSRGEESERSDEVLERGENGSRLRIRLKGCRIRRGRRPTGSFPESRRSACPFRVLKRSGERLASSQPAPTVTVGVASQQSRRSWSNLRSGRGALRSAERQGRCRSLRYSRERPALTGQEVFPHRTQRVSPRWTPYRRSRR